MSNVGSKVGGVEVSHPEGVVNFYHTRKQEIQELTSCINLEVYGIDQGELFVSHLILTYAEYKKGRKRPPSLIEYLNRFAEVADQYLSTSLSAVNLISLTKQIHNGDRGKVFFGLVKRYTESAGDHLAGRLVETPQSHVV